MDYNPKIDFPFKPSEDRIIVERQELANKTNAGVYIPDTAEDRPLKGKIMAVGDFMADKYKPGDIISYGKFAGTEILIADKEYLIMRSGDIFGTFLF